MPRAVKSAPSSPCSRPRVMPPGARPPQLTLVRLRVARQQPSLARPNLLDAHIPAMPTFLADSLSVPSHFHLSQTSARSVAVACCSQSLVPPPSYLFERSQASYERSHPQPTPVPSEPTTFTLVACLSRAYGPYRHHTEELRGVHNSWQGGGNS
jgi:hypothetical protein